jgi:peptidoglycan/LPS O-acetylase OafA/YrhL
MNAWNAPTATSKPDYRFDIDGLRAIAVLAVLAFHWKFPGASGGYLGVDVFFVISGFLITSLIRKDIERGTFSFLSFWERRVRRIAPALLATMVATLFAGAFFLFAPDLRQLGVQSLAQSFFSSNILFAAQSGYFDQEAQFKPLLHTWSLSVEEQYYLFFPILMALLYSMSRRASVAGILMLLALSYAACIWGGEYHPFGSFYLLPFRAWELLLGALVTYLPTISISRLEKEVVGIGSLLWLVASFALFDETTHMSAIMVIPCLCTALLLWLGKSEKRTFVTRILGWDPLVGIGLISYSLYLWHWPIYVFARYMSVGEELPVQTVALFLGATFAVAVLSWKYIETPVRSRKILASRKHLFVVIFSVTAIIALTGAAFYVGQGFPARFSAEINQYASALEEESPHRGECHMMSPEKIRAQGPCAIGNIGKEGIADFLAIGDSFLDSLSPLLVKMADDNGVKGFLASYDSCPPLIDIYRSNQQKSYDCRGVNRETYAFAEKTGVKRVLLVARWQEYADLFYLSDRIDAFPRLKEEREDFLRQKIIETVEYWQSKGVEVWIVKVPPSYGVSLPRYLALQLRLGREIPEGMSLAEHRRENASIGSVFAEIGDANVRFIDTADLLCELYGNCHLEFAGKSLYRDSHHLSIAGAMYLQPAFAEFMKF